jgi:acetoin utilization protein AcuB
MFYVFGSTGRTFQGTLEALRRVNKTSDIRSERTLIDPYDPGGLPVIPPQPASTSTTMVSNKRAAQYSDMLVKQGNLEVVYHAYQIMTQPPKCISSHWSLSRVTEYFRNLPFQVFPIVDERRQLIGLLSRRHFYEYLLSENTRRLASSGSVADYFISGNSRVYCADPITDVRRIATLLVEKALEAVPIVEESGRLVGIVSRTDILKCTTSDPPLSLWC